MFTGWLMQHHITPQVLIFAGVILAALGALWSAHERNKADLVHRNEITRVREEVLAAQTGGDSFCYFRHLRGSGPRGPNITVSHEGAEPLYGVSAMVLHRQFDAEGRMRLEDVFSHPIGDQIPATTDTRRDRFHWAPWAERVEMTVTFQARNGIWSQTTYLEHVNDQWTAATRVERYGEILKEDVDLDFPRGPNGQVNWQSLKHQQPHSE